MPGLDNPITVPAVAIAAAWQTAEGNTSPVAGAQIFHVESSNVDPQVSHVMPLGTTGSQFVKDTHRKVSEEPIAALTMFASRHQMPVFLESLFRGQPQTLNADLTETGDGGAVLSVWVLNGVRPGFNTDNTGMGIIYVTLDADSPGATDTTVNLYSDAARTLLVATGVIVDGSVPGTMTLNEANNSGLSGTVDVASVPVADNATIQLDINKITYTKALQWTRFFTFWQDNGDRADRLTDCVVTSLKITGADKGSLMAEIEIAAKQYDDISGGLFTPALENNAVYMYQDLVVRSDVDGTPDREFPNSAELEIRSRFTTVLGTDTDPQKLIAEGFEQIRGNLVFRPAEGEDLLFQQGLNDTVDSWDFVATVGADILTFTLDRVKVVEPKRPDVEAETMADNTIEFIAVERADASVDPIVTTIEG